ncbi:hypothetical protein TNCT_149481 [Trichonephila clavata]|uniref:Uncharacterized protein n=1 Tax=Trichonephila clavata TaxID=2740835 RepID=A0A8X6LM54_TRICU|nr:hypothetical protein TNCT_149481 [Trichonephila clavata]
MHAGWSYRDPSARCMRWGSVMFIPPRHDINRPVEEFRTEICIHRPYVLMHAGRPTATRPPGICSGVVYCSFRKGTTLTGLWKNSEQNFVSTDLAFSCMRDGLTKTCPHGVCGGVA